MSARQRQRDWLAATVSQLIWPVVLAVVPPPVPAATTTGESTRRPAAKVSFVAEMEQVPELAVLQDGRRWSRQEQAAWSDDMTIARAAWRENAKALTGLLTVDRVRCLSRWAKQQMEQYSAVPALAEVTLEPIGLVQEPHRLLLEGTIDTLPSHHPLVTRWLKVYVVYDIPARKLSHVTFTIRGQRLE